MLHLDLLGILCGRAQGDGDVVGDMVAGDGNDRGMADGAVGEDCQVGGAAAYVHQAYAQVFFVFRQYRVARRQLFQDDVVRFQAATAHTLDDVLGRADRAGDDVHLRFQPHAGHADRLLDAFLPVDDEIPGNYVQYLLVCRDGDGFRRVNHPFDIACRNFIVADRDDAVGVQAADVVAGNSREYRVDVAPCHQFRFLNGAADGLHRRLYVDYHPFLQPSRPARPQTDDFDLVLIIYLGNYGNHLGSADVKPDN